MKSSILKTVLITCTAFLVLVVSQCTKDKTAAPPEPCDPNKVYYSNDIYPLISTNCSSKDGCHGPGQDLNLSTYKGLMQIVKPGKPNDSEIMKVVNSTNIEDRMPRDPNPALSQAQKDLISKWISEGALNNSCTNDTANCFSGTVSYSVHIVDLLSNCQSCHSGNVLKGNVDLSNYPGVQKVGLNGKLYNAVAQNGKAIPMPVAPNPKLPSCDIKMIKSWVDAGCLNN